MSGETTELLRKGLTEHGIEWRSGLDGVTWVGDWCFVEYDNGRLAATCEPVLTPEQAISATFGSEREKALEELVHDWQVLAEARLEDEIAQSKRIVELESLVREMWPWVWESGIASIGFSELKSRIETLGIEVD